MGKVGYLECPYCGHRSTSMAAKDKKVKCDGCKKSYGGDKVKIIECNETIVICKVCGNEVSLTPNNFEKLNRFGYLCPKCFNIAAIKYKEMILQPEEVLDVEWNKKIKEKAIKITESLFLAECRSEKDYLVFKIMHLKAREEEMAFLPFKKKKQKACILFDISRAKYIGYVIWSKNKIAALRQIYIEKEERCKGYGTLLLKTWVNNISDRINDEFIVEAPNEKSRGMLIKLGYAKIEGEELIGLKCHFTWSS